MTALFEIGLSNLVVATGLALIIAPIRRFLGSPALVHGLWLLVLVKLLTPPVVPVQIPVSLPHHWQEFVSISSRPRPIPHGTSETAFRQSRQAAGAVAAHRTNQHNVQPQELAWPIGSVWRRLAFGLLGIWLIGTAAYFAAATVRALRFRRLLQMTDRPPAVLQEEVDRLATRMGLPRGPQLALVPGPVSPMLWSIGGWARLLFPTDLLKRLTPEARETLLLHELAHLWRRDHWVRIIEFLATGLYWWNPVVWWARREIHIAEEDCCDAWVLWQWPSGRRTYATALLETIEFLSETRPVLPLAACGIGRVELMKRRLKRIMLGTASRGLSASGRWAIAALALVLLPTFPQTQSTLANPQPVATASAGSAEWQDDVETREDRKP